MIPVVLKDPLPRALGYPVGEQYLSEQLGADVPLEDLGLFFLFTSGIQLDHYDPLTSAEECYPVIALDRKLPPLVSHAEARLREARRSKAERAGVLKSWRATGGPANAPIAAPPVDLSPIAPCEVAIMVFPVKARMRRRVTDAIEFQGIQLIRNWLTAGPEVRQDQKPLVLVFDEASGRVTARFVKDSGSRRLYR